MVVAAAAGGAGWSLDVAIARVGERTARNTSCGELEAVGTLTNSRRDADGERGRQHRGPPSGDPAPVTDRLLDPDEGDDRDPEREPEPEGEEPGAVEASPLRAQPEVDRPVVEVHAVAHEPERAQRRDPERGPDRPGDQHRRDDQRDEHRVQRETAAVEEVVALADDGPGSDEHAERDRAAGRDRDAHAPVGEPLAAGERDRQQRADQQLDRTRVGAVVHAGRVVPGGEQHRCEHRRAGRERPDDDGEAAARAAGPERHADEQQREHQVELLLDCERPEVLHRRGCGEQRGVRLVAEHEAPVRHIAQRTEPVARQPSGLVSVGDGQAVDRDPGQRDERGRQDAARPPGPEAAEGDPAAVVALLEQQGRDEEAGEGEEDADAEKAAGRPAEAGVEQQDTRDRQPSQAVERRHPRGIPPGSPHTGGGCHAPGRAKRGSNEPGC